MKSTSSLTERMFHRELSVNSALGRRIYTKRDVGGVMMTVVSAYAPQVGCLMEDKDKFSTDLNDVVESISKGREW